MAFHLCAEMAREPTEPLPDCSVGNVQPGRNLRGRKVLPEPESNQELVVLRQCSHCCGEQGKPWVTGAEFGLRAGLPGLRAELGGVLGVAAGPAATPA